MGEELADLYLSFAPAEKWREHKGVDAEHRARRLLILERDDYTCAYCGFKSNKYQIMHHIDDNPKNNNESNLQTVCQMCNLILHAGQGCVVQGVVDIYKQADYSQSEIIKITREMRDKGASDSEIKTYLGLKTKVPFKEDVEYLRQMFGFITSRKTKHPDMYSNWIAYRTGEQWKEIIYPSQITNDYWVHAKRKRGKYPKPTKNCGKWLVFLNIADLDEVWEKIALAVEKGRLGNSAKAATAKPNPNAANPDTKVICVYTYDSEDKTDVARIAYRLYELDGVKMRSISYKKDTETREGKYAVKGDKKIARYSITHAWFENKTEEEFIAYFKTNTAEIKPLSHYL